MEKDKQHIILGVCTTVCRFVLAGVFIFSGFVKSVDPLGTQYKILDYINAFGWASVFPDSLALLASLTLGILEFCLGVYLFFGIRRILAPRLLVALMAVMTPFTFWLALDNPVSDCGCFGDAVVLSNWETFGKNVVLLLMSLVVLRWRKRIFPLVSVRFDWLIGLYGFVYIFGMVIYCYRELPVFDFRPYHIGADIRRGMEVPEGEKPTKVETVFTLRKEGVEKEFTADNYPDSTWTFVDSKLVVKEQGYEPPIQDFYLLRMEDGEDITEEVLSDENYTFLLVAHQLDLADDSANDLINELYDYSLNNGYAFYCVTSSSDDDIWKWRENTGAEYPFCLMDNTTMRTMVRSNPGLVLLKEGVVLRKWSVNNLPDEYQLQAPLDELPFGKVDNSSLVYKILWVLAWFVFPLLLICVLDVMFGLFHPKESGLEQNLELKKEWEYIIINFLIK